ncbi:MAG: hypothetical protein QOH57_2519 [Mycobacterium sp.]|jgi:hypothetical protein|nr:hypothetical protein [Mycobacterium sp.]
MRKQFSCSTALFAIGAAIAAAPETEPLAVT